MALLEDVTAVAGVIAAAAAVPAAIYAVKAFRAQRASSTVADQRYAADVQPRPRVQTADFSETDVGLTVTYGNPGGAAVNWTAVLQHGPWLYLLKTDVPRHYQMPPGGTSTLRPLMAVGPDLAAGKTNIAASFALDVDGNAWDVNEGERFDGTLLDYLRPRLSKLGAVLRDDGVIEPAPPSEGANESTP